MSLITLSAVVAAAVAVGTNVIGVYYILHYLDRMEQRINQRFNELEQRMNQRFDAMDRRMDRFEERMDRFEERLTALTIEVRVMQGREPNGGLEKRSS